MGMIKEFKEFALKGNMMDMAIGIIIGGAFGTIVKSLVNDVMMPAIGYISGGLDFSDLAFSMTKMAPVSAKLAEKDVLIKYGLFFNALIAFLIVAFVLFLLVKGMNKAKEAMAKKQEEEEKEKAAEPSAQEVLLTEIRDLLKKQAGA
jgi:large conductance mechanosensitive channel